MRFGDIPDKGAEIVAAHHKREVDAATELMDKAEQAVMHRDHRHAIDLLQAAVRNLEKAEILQEVLKDISKTEAPR